MAENVLLRHEDIPDIHKLDVYLAHDGYAAARTALTTLKPEEVTAQVKASNLRGRGGAPAGGVGCGQGDSQLDTRGALVLERKAALAVGKFR